ncbi:microcystin-dependent protein [Longilinea arvoryzae]|uniref:Microcystin-dependent protein n=1 Tax=Longilinea arvoryzae TaxID=360412 RepID=A0A0S7B665_9CHLR|nr:tail fiber protein [Longilinea arvoryzae]GAP12607.1 microcystin-dependent protein [Longilinea arvoryzae]
MSVPYMSEIRIFSFSFAPKGWAMCNGQLLPIQQNQALFALLGTTYGGDGRVNFALPNLQGRMPIHSLERMGEAGGESAHTLTVPEIPVHNHPVSASSAAANSTTAGGNLCASENVPAYADNPAVSMNPAAVANVGGNQPHPNMPPYLALNFCIALSGVFPSRD